MIQTMLQDALVWLTTDPLGRLAALLLAVLVILASVRLLGKLVSVRIEDREARYRTRKLIVGLGYVAFIGIFLALFGPRMSDVAVIAGFASAGLAFALQEVIASFAGYVAISFGGFFRVGDRVQLGGIRGDVIDISMLRTTLMELGEWVHGDLYNGRVVRVANSFLFKEPVFNYSGDFPFVWDEVTVPIRFGSDHEAARNLFQSIADEISAPFVAVSKGSWDEMKRKFNIEDARLEAMVTLAINDNWIEYKIRYVTAFDRRRVVRDQLFTAVLSGVEKSNGAIQFGSTTIDIVGFPARPETADQ